MENNSVGRRIGTMCSVVVVALAGFVGAGNAAADPETCRAPLSWERAEFDPDTYLGRPTADGSSDHYKASLLIGGHRVSGTQLEGAV